MAIEDENWQVPRHDRKVLFEKKTKYCVCVPVINEGHKIQKQLKKMSPLSFVADIIILDGGSTDGSLEESVLKEAGVRTLLVKKDGGKLSAQLRMGFAYALREGYEGIITVDGNNKDSLESIPDFIHELDKGYDFVQGSRYVKGGRELNTPWMRKWAIRLIHAPFISFVSRFRYTDTTNGFRGHSRAFLLDPELQPFRQVFETYELLAYLSVKAPLLGYRVKEIAVTREYPLRGKTPTKISPLKGNLLLMKILFNIMFHKYDVR